MKSLILISAFLIISCTPLNAKEKMLDIQKVTSKSGITAWLVEDKSLPVISLKFSFRGAGAVRDGEDKQGLARLVSNTMDEGSGDLSSQEFQKKLSDNSITLFFNSGRDNFGGEVKTLSRHKDLAFDLLRTALTKPRFDEEPVERMRQANLSRIRSSMGDPDWIAARLFNDIAFAGHPYALNSGGTLSTLPAITTEDLNNFVKNWLTKDRLVIGITGDIDKKELAILLDQIFSDLPAVGQQENLTKQNLKNGGKIFVYHKDIPQTIISTALPAFDKNDPDYYALKIMNYIYGGSGFGSRLMEEAREKRGLTYGIYSGLMSQDYIDGFTISTSTKNNSAKEIVDIIKQEMTAIKTNPVTAQELLDAKSYITGSMPLSLSSTDNVAGILLGLQMDERPIDYLDQYADKINAVTAKDIQKVAQRIFNAENLTTIMVGQPEGFDTAKEIKDVPNVQ